MGTNKLFFLEEYEPDLILVNPLMNNSFMLMDAIGNCATYLHNNRPFHANKSLYKSCFCCGNKYNPDPSLNCPISPWS